MEYLKLFGYWITERYNIWCDRDIGKPFPWTRDKILQEYKFTNAYRELDAVTIELRKRQKEAGKLSKTKQLWLIVLFRMFNHPPTYDLLKQFVKKPWDKKVARKMLKAAKANGEQVFTGAYIITNNGSTRPKIDLVCDALEVAYKILPELQRALEKDQSIEGAVKLLSEYIPMVGKFIAYEFACDMYESLDWFNPTDRLKWANPGPGAMRGLNRIHSPSHKPNDKTRRNGRKPDYVAEMHDLLHTQMPNIIPMMRRMPSMDMRVIEHSLCEFDKYCRVLHGEGKPRSKFKPPME